MKWQILHQSRGRLRVHLCTPHLTLRQADIVEYYLRGIPGVTDVQVFDRTRDAVIRYEETTDRRDALVQALRAFTFATAEELATVPEHTARALNREFEDKLVACVLRLHRHKALFTAADKGSTGGMPLTALHPRGAAVAAARAADGQCAGCHGRDRFAAAGRLQHRRVGDVHAAPW